MTATETRSRAIAPSFPRCPHCAFMPALLQVNVHMCVPQLSTTNLLIHQPSNLKALYRLGSCQRDFGDVEVARATFAKGCDIAPDDGSMRRGLRGCDAKLRRDQAATCQVVFGASTRAFRNGTRGRARVCASQALLSP